jgi:hypothetical protein
MGISKDTWSREGQDKKYSWYYNVEEVRRVEERELPRRGWGIFGDGRASGRIVQIWVRHFG